MSPDDPNDVLEALRDARYRQSAADMLAALSRLEPEMASVAMEHIESVGALPLEGVSSLSERQWSRLEALLQRFIKGVNWFGDTSWMPVFRAWRRILIAGARWDRALKICQTLLLHMNRIEGPEERCELYHHLGLIRAQQGQEARARAMFERALSQIPDHEPTLEALRLLAGGSR